MNLSKKAIKQIGMSQRALCLWILIVICLFIIAQFYWPPIRYAAYIGPLIVIPNVWKMSNCFGNETSISVLLCIGILIPLLGTIILVLMSIKATGILKKAGLHVGLMGAPKKELDKLK